MFRSENFKFRFSAKIRGTEYKIWEIELQKIVGNLLHKLRKLYLKEMVT